MRVFFNGNQYVLIEYDPDFEKHYGDGESGYFVPITRQVNQHGGLFGVLIIPGDDWHEDTVRHESVHVAAAWVRVHGYTDTEEEAIAVLQDDFMDGFWKEFDKE